MKKRCLLQTIFNPNFFNLDISFGREWGVNWVWAIFILGYHAIWSITIPVIITEALFHNRRKERWTNSLVFGIVIVVFIIMVIHYHQRFYSLTGFQTPLMNYSLAVVVTIIIIFISVKLPHPISNRINANPPTIFQTGLASVIASFIWLGLSTTIFVDHSGVSAALVISLGIINVITFSILVVNWAKKKWTILHLYGLASGGLLVGLFYGLLVLSESHSSTDTISQILFIVAGPILLFLLGKKFSQSNSSS